MLSREREREREQFKLYLLNFKLDCNFKVFICLDKAFIQIGFGEKKNFTLIIKNANDSRIYY